MRRHLPNDVKREKARRNFYVALLTVAVEGVDGSRVEPNPIQLLQSRVLPEWKSAAVIQVPRRNFLKYLEATEQRDRTRSRLLNEWAIDCKLVGPDDQPLPWMVDEARRLCEKWSMEGSGTNRRFVPMIPTTGVSSLHPPGTSDLTPAFLTVPMKDAARRPGERPDDYKKRVRKALNKYIRNLDVADDLRAPEPFESGRKRASNPPAVKLEHFIWVVLFLCCGWSLKEISAAYNNLSTSAISRAVAEKAELIGIHRKEKPFEKKL